MNIKGIQVTIKATTLSALITLCAPGSLRAQSTAFTYKGRLNTNGSPATGIVRALAVSGSNLYADAVDRVERWDGSSWSALGSGVGAAVYALERQ
jgi:hypothetical protein